MHSSCHTTCTGCLLLGYRSAAALIAVQHPYMQPWMQKKRWKYTLLELNNVPALISNKLPATV
jgi:hypothetical protein